jgi:hypothetical protein
MANNGAGVPSSSSGGGNKPESVAGGKGYDKQEWHGTKMYRTESGIEVRMGDTPKNREVWIKHPTGNYIHINDTGEVAFRAKGTHVEINMDDRTMLIKKDLTISVKGNITMRAEGEMNLEAKSISMKSTGGNIDIHSAANITQEADSNWSTSTKENVDHKNGARYAQTVGGETNLTYNANKQDTTKGDVTTTVKGDSTTMIGGEGSTSAGGTLGMGGSEIGIASTGQTTIKAAGGTMNIEAASTTTVKGSTIQLNPA